ncbi:putative bifunctional diguanylate cyclase/phosphodiesterase [Kineococcus sp. SYSU DK006]|uniref:putative bifunctional diguanylate cyclase/phosphodiesterase n=1 Tax=Kineococcus sp. SYSU DK006 TaxID=3383127 RepID=UPI003D7DCCEA
MGSTTLVDGVADLAAEAAEQSTPDDLLRRLADVAARHLAVDGIGVVVLEDGAARFVHADCGAVDTVERLQQLVQEGPCRDAAETRSDVVVADLADPAQTAWPEFVARALALGLGAVLAVPLVSRGRTWGVLDLYRHRAGPWTAGEIATAHLLARVAVSYLVMAADRDEARRAQAELAHRSTHDPLTGLPNRVLLFDRLEHALRAARRHHRVVAVLFLDLDRFKAVNDTFGHAAGDTVLTTAATRMAGVLRDEDTLARLAGDEFVVLCEDLPQAEAGELAEHVQAVTSRLRRALAEPIRVGGVDLVVRASIGTALGDGRRSADELLADADAAMYRLKHGPGHLRDRPEGPGDGGSVRRLERQVLQALPQGQLRVHYQPITDPTGHVHAVEALLRWQHPEQGLLPAARFIDLVAGTEAVVGIGRWVLEQTCAQVARWQRELGARAPATAYVNLGARELADPGLTGALTTALRTHRLDPEQLGLELLENSFSDLQVLPALHEQQRRGHPLSVDDFGTGYSSLSRLVELPVRMAKIDQSFVAGLADDPRRRALVDAVVTVATSLDLRVIAEGVETAEQASRAAEAGCHYLQGFHCGHPQPGEALTALWAG